MKNGLEKLGSLIWRQSKEIAVSKFAFATVYEIPTPLQTKYVILEKNTVSIVDELPLSNSMVEKEKFQENKSKEIFIPLR
jgi:hypothetical protein